MDKNDKEQRRAYGNIEIIGEGTPTFVARYEKDAEREGGRL